MSEPVSPRLAALAPDAAAAVEQAAAACGFGSPANLRKHYRKRFGETPAETLRGR